MTTTGTTTSLVSAAASALLVAGAAPVAGFAADITGIVAALVGVVTVQTLMPASHIRLWHLVTITVGSLGFSVLAAPWLHLWALDNVMYMRQLPDWQAHALVSGFAGGFAQPLLLGGKRLLEPLWERLFPAAAGGRGSQPVGDDQGPKP